MIIRAGGQSCDGYFGDRVTGWRMDVFDDRLVRISVGKGRVPEPDNVISMPNFGKPREATNELLAVCMQSKRKYRAISEVEFRFAKLGVGLVCIREAVSIHRHDMNARA